jgi:RIO-like serine/threonine protein kinase
MDLIKQNIEKGRSVYYNNGHYVKSWTTRNPQWIKEHVDLLNKIVPDFVLEYGGNWISYKTVEGTPASKFEHTDEFIQKIYDFCIDSIKQTHPYVHGDWVLSNIIVKDDGSLMLIDWDNIGIYPEDEYMNKLHQDLSSAFGEERYK